MVKVFRKLGCTRIPDDPCLIYLLTPASIITWLSWIDDFLHMSKQDEIEDTKEKFMKELDCEDSD